MRVEKRGKSANGFCMETKRARFAGLKMVFGLHFVEALFAIKVTVFIGLALMCLCLWNDFPKWASFNLSYGVAVVIGMGFVAYRAWAGSPTRCTVNDERPGKEFSINGDASPWVSGLAVIVTLFFVPYFSLARSGSAGVTTTDERFELSSSDALAEPQPTTEAPLPRSLHATKQRVHLQDEDEMDTPVPSSRKP